MFERLADIVVRHPKAIVALWVVALLAAAYPALSSPSVFQYDMTSMMPSDTESAKGAEILGSDYFYPTAAASTIILVEALDESAQEVSEALAAALDAELADWSVNRGLREKYGDSVQITAGKLGVFDDRYFQATVSSMILFGIEYPALPDGSSLNRTSYVPDIREMTAQALESIADPGLKEAVEASYVTGSDAITYDTMTAATADMEKIDPVSILLIFILIGLFFRSIVTAAIPPMVIGMAYAIVLGAVFFVGQIMGIYYITPILVLVSMLGAGCDYCIFIISRYREERKRGSDGETAIRESVKWAGESILTSGCSVIIGFGIMAFCSFSMVSTMGIALALGIVVALIASLTLIPSLLAIFGDRLFWPSTMDTYAQGSRAMKGWYGKWSSRGQRYFAGTVKASMRHSKALVVAVILITLPLTYVAVTSAPSYDMISTMPDSESKQGVSVISAGIGGGMIMPTYIVMKVDAFADIDPEAETYVPRDNAEQFYRDMSELTGSLLEMRTQGQENISITYGPTDGDTLFDGSPAHQRLFERLVSFLPQSTQEAIAYLEEVLGVTGYEAICEVWYLLTDEEKYTADYMLTYTMGAVSQVFEEDGRDYQYVKVTVVTKEEPMSDLSIKTVSQLYSAESGFAGSHSYVNGSYITGAAVMTYEVSEIVTEDFDYIKAAVILLLILLLFLVMRSYVTPIRAVLTILMSIMWTLGLTFILFDQLMGVPVVWIVPIVLFVICLGLGMDYDILLTTRIKENVMKGMSNDEAIEAAVMRSGAVITLCGLIMAGAFSTLMFSTSPMLQEFGFALGFAIAIDALFIRTYIVPAIMHILGDWNWKGPGSAVIRTRGRDPSRRCRGGERRIR